MIAKVEHNKIKSINYKKRCRLVMRYKKREYARLKRVAR